MANAAAQPKDNQQLVRRQVREVEHSLKLMNERLVSALPSTITIRQFVTTVLTACTIEPKLLNCDRQSLFLACVKSARDGLLPDGREAALVPFNENQEDGPSKKVVTYAAYAIAKTKNGGTYRRVLGEDDVKLIKAFSKAKKGPWHGSFESEMWIKSVIRRLAKILPQSTDINSYLANGPALPEPEASSVLPDAIGEEGVEQAAFDLKARALLALNESPNELASLVGNWNGVKQEYQKIGIEVPLDAEDVYQMKLEALKPENQTQG